mmetsp:Transcript_117019/g.377621  ORF Transcript_117019/g.377621 Transcript_117019/m.377621 type:complete len:230 (-) Transcript_117019:610-1299(-)
MLGGPGRGPAGAQGPPRAQARRHVAEPRRQRPRGRARALPGGARALRRHRGPGLVGRGAAHAALAQGRRHEPAAPRRDPRRPPHPPRGRLQVLRRAGRRGAVVGAQRREGQRLGRGALGRPGPAGRRPAGPCDDARQRVPLLALLLRARRAVPGRQHGGACHRLAVPLRLRRRPGGTAERPQGRRDVGHQQHHFGGPGRRERARGAADARAGGAAGGGGPRSRAALGVA